MKIAILAPLVTPIREPQLGGSQGFVSDLARGLAGRGHEVHVYAASGSQIPGVTVIDTGVDARALSGTLYRADARDSSATASASQAAETAFGAAYATKRSGEWEFVEYRVDGSYITPPQKSATCAECHIKAGAEKDFVYKGRFDAAGKK